MLSTCWFTPKQHGPPFGSPMGMKGAQVAFQDVLAGSWICCNWDLDQQFDMGCGGPKKWLNVCCNVQSP